MGTNLEPPAFSQYLDNALSSKLRFVLKVGNDIQQFNIIIVNGRITGRAGFLHAASASSLSSHSLKPAHFPRIFLIPVSLAISGPCVVLR